MDAEPMEIKMYDIEDVERMARRRKEEEVNCLYHITSVHALCITMQYKAVY